MKFFRRRHCCIWHLVLGLIIVIFSALAQRTVFLAGAINIISESPPSSDDDNDDNKQECKNENGEEECSSKNEQNKKRVHRIVTPDELGLKTGEDGSAVWLSILGDIYDVTNGKSFYGKGRSYGAFAGRDCTVCFVSGVFTAEEATKSTDELTDALLPGILDWAKFYATHKNYKFIGYLVDPRYYNEKGEPTTNLIGLRKRFSASVQKQKEIERERAAKKIEKANNINT
jgi:hypothetical protein